MCRRKICTCVCRCANPAGTYGDQKSTLSSCITLCLTTFKYLYLFVLLSVNICSNTTPQWKASGVHSPPISHPHLRSPFPCHRPASTQKPIHFYHGFCFITNQRKSKQVSKAFCYNSHRNFEKPHQAGNNRWDPTSLVEFIPEETGDVALTGCQTGRAGKLLTH